VNIISKRNYLRITLAILLVINSTLPAFADKMFVYTNEIRDEQANTLIIDSDDTGGLVELIFGNTINAMITHDGSLFHLTDDLVVDNGLSLQFRDSALSINSSVDGQLDINADIKLDITSPAVDVSGLLTLGSDIDVNANEMLTARIENVSVLPGGAAGLGVVQEGRIVILDTLDSTAPGCTVSPFCASGIYIWDGGAWISLTGETSSTLTKVVTVGSSGADYLTIDNAAAYLTNRSGGIILLSAEVHTVDSSIDLTNVTLIGKDASRTTILMTGAGQMDSFDTTFQFLTINTGALIDDMVVDVQTGSTSLVFDYVDINIQDAGDVLIDSNEATAPSITAKFIKSNSTGGAGAILKPIATANIAVSSNIFIDSRSSDNPLELNDWDVTLGGGGSVNTSGIITSVPDRSIFVSPDMNLQGAIDSLKLHYQEYDNF